MKAYRSLAAIVISLSFLWVGVNARVGAPGDVLDQQDETHEGVQKGHMDSILHDQDDMGSSIVVMDHDHRVLQSAMEEEGFGEDSDEDFSDLVEGYGGEDEYFWKSLKRLARKAARSKIGRRVSKAAVKQAKRLAQIAARRAKLLRKKAVAALKAVAKKAAAIARKKAVVLKEAAIKYAKKVKKQVLKKAKESLTDVIGESHANIVMKHLEATADDLGKRSLKLFRNARRAVSKKAKKRLTALAKKIRAKAKKAAERVKKIADKVKRKVASYLDIKAKKARTKARKESSIAKQARKKAKNQRWKARTKFTKARKLKGTARKVAFKDAHSALRQAKKARVKGDILTKSARLAKLKAKSLTKMDENARKEAHLHVKKVKVKIPKYWSSKDEAARRASLKAKRKWRFVGKVAKKRRAASQADVFASYAKEEYKGVKDARAKFLASKKSKSGRRINS